MSGERELKTLLQSMKPELQSGVFVFCTLPEAQQIPVTVNPVFTFREQEGKTFVLLREEAEHAGLSYQYASRQITLTVHSSLETVGFLAVITERLAQADISVNPVSAFFHDHLFVPQNRADEAMQILLSLVSA